MSETQGERGVIPGSRNKALDNNNNNLSADYQTSLKALPYLAVKQKQSLLKVGSQTEGLFEKLKDSKDFI